jgi:hypothetical protein
MFMCWEPQACSKGIYISSELHQLGDLCTNATCRHTDTALITQAHTCSCTFLTVRQQSCAQHP